MTHLGLPPAELAELQSVRVQESQDGILCAGCGVLLPTKPLRRGRRYCSPKCRVEGWRRRPVVLGCGKPKRQRPLVPVEAERLSRQCRAILDRLRRGPATNRELSELSLKYTSRVSDLRAAGYRVEVLSRDYETGVCVYELRA